MPSLNFLSALPVMVLSKENFFSGGNIDGEKAKKKK